jgi:hypothetical protein
VLDAVWIKKLIPCFGPVQSMLIVVDLRGGGPPSQAPVGGSKMHRTSKMHQFLGIPAIAAPPKLPTKVITIAAYIAAYIAVYIEIRLKVINSMHIAPIYSPR